MSIELKKLPGAAFLAFPEMTEFLEKELIERSLCSVSDIENAQRYGELLYIPSYSSKSAPYWCRAAMTEPFTFHFESISEAANTLRDIQRSWAPYLTTQFRRGSLIQDKMPYVNLKVRQFPCTIPRSPIGLYTLLDANTMFASAVTNSFLPAGLIQFEEDHENPPSRAYLKLQEALVRYPLMYPDREIPLPQKGDRCFDAGACPGGWTWVLRRLGCSVFAVDRAELSPPLMADKMVTFKRHDAFTLEPSEIGPFDWVFSDVICYPERLYEWVEKWLESGLCRHIICTIKLQGAPEWPVIEKFAALPSASIVHLNYNKNELTLYVPADRK